MHSYTFVLLLACSYASASFHPRLDGRIVGGHEVDIKDFPYQVSMQLNGRHWCGGSIISENWVLTASHCVENNLNPASYKFRVGSSMKNEGGSLHQVTEIIMHPQYKLMDFDYALMHVSESFQVGNSGVQIIQMASTEPDKDTLTVASGWGALFSGGSSPTHLQAVDVHIVDRDACNTAYSNQITKRMICAADLDKDACQGDSGGPLVDKTSGELVGVVSWGYGCADPEFPGVYSNVAEARDWVKEVTGI